VATRYRLSFSSAARADLLDAKLWLTQPGSGRKGHERYAALNKAVLELRDGHHRWPVGEFDGVREQPAHGYRIYYQVDDGHREVMALRVFGPFQDRTRL